MSEQTTANSLLALSRQLEHLAEAVAHAVVGIRLHGRLVASGLVWKPGVVVTASAALEADDDISVIAPPPANPSRRNSLVGIRPPTSPCCASATTCRSRLLTMSEAARVGQMVLALGRGEDGVIANLGMVSVAGGPWQSMRGGNIDSLIRLDMRLSRRAEGGLVVDSEGRVLGMPVFGPRQATLSSRCQRSSVSEPSCSRTAAFGADIGRRLAWHSSRRSLGCVAFAARQARNHGRERRSQRTGSHCGRARRRRDRRIRR